MFRTLTSSRLLGLHLLAVVATTVAVLLGLWQYHAWQLHRDAQADDLANVPSKALAQVFGSDDPYPGNAVGQPVHFTGGWLPDGTVYVADREQQGRAGFWVVTPVSVCDTGCTDRPAILVVRGWTPRVADAPPPPIGPVRVTGWLQPPEGSGLTDPDPGDDVIPEVRVADAIQHVDQDLYGGYVIADRAAAGDLTGADGTLTAVTPQSLPEPDAFTGIRNLLYALEWWVFGGFALFLWWRWCSDELARVDDVPAGSTGTAPARDAEVASSP